MKGIRRMVEDTLWNHDEFVKEQKAVEEAAAELEGEAREEHLNLHDVDRGLAGYGDALLLATDNLPALVEDLMLLFWSNADKLISVPSMKTAKHIAKMMLPTGYDAETIEWHAQYLIKELKDR